MGTKGVPFEYLEFLRAIRRKPCPHARATSGGGGFGFGFHTRSGSFWTGPHRYGVTTDRTRSRSAINSAPFSHFKTQKHTESFFCILKWLPSSAFWSESLHSPEVKVKIRSEIEEEVTRILKIRSERRLRKFNRFFNRIVVWICDFQRRIFFYLPPFSTVGVPPK